MSGEAEREQLARMLDLVRREDEHLLAVRKRFLSDDCDVDAQRVGELLAEDVGIDRLESFGAKFSRMQDTVVDKLIPVFLRVAGESTGAAIDNLNRMERIGLIASAEDWLQMRGFRNRLVHEYIDSWGDLALALSRVCQFTDRMHADFLAIHEYAVTRLGIAC